MIKDLKRLHADSDSFRERRMERQKAQKRGKSCLFHKACCIKRQQRSLEQTSAHLPAQPDQISLSLSLQLHHTLKKQPNSNKVTYFFIELTPNQQFHNMYMHLRRYKKFPPQLPFSLISASIQFRNSLAGDGCWAGLSPALVHMQVPVQPQFTHTLIFLKQHPISSGS